MKNFKIISGIAQFATFHDFAQEMMLSGHDLVITNSSIFAPVVKNENSGCLTLFLEDYGSGEPTDEMVDAILKDLEDCRYDRIIAIGGGSVIDVAKFICLARKGDTTDALFDRKDSLTKVCPLIVIPTTCGTGSEVTSVAVVNRLKMGTKMGLQTDAMYPDQAALIEEMLGSLPYGVFATSSIDAMVHAAESYLSPNACAHSRLFSKDALRLLVGSWVKAVQNGNPEKDWKNNAADYLLGANEAGIAFGYAGCGAVHACAYPLGGVHHVAHGQSNQMMFAAVMKKYKELAPVGRINELEDILADILGCEREAALENLYALMDKILPLRPLHEVGMSEEEITLFARDVIENQQRLLKNNYIPFTEDDLADIYRSAF